MNEKILLRFGVLILVIVLCTAMILGLYFGADSVNDVKVSSSLKGRDGSEIYSTSIYDVCSLSAMPYANYTADEFLIPKSEISGTPVNLREQNDFASKGTFVFVIRNLDPFDPDFSTKASVLNDKFLQGDGSWHLTFFIPQVWSSCNVYVNYVLESRVGDISDYQFSNYTDYYMSTVAHKTKTEPLFIDLTFYPKIHTISADPLEAAAVITIHYEAAPNMLAGIDAVPLIGKDTAVYSAIEKDLNLSAVLCVIAAIANAVFVFVCLLKRSLSFLPCLLTLSGVFIVLVTSYLLANAVYYPYFLQALRIIALVLTYTIAFLSLKPKTKSKTVWSVIMAAFAIFATTVCFSQILHFVPVMSDSVWGIASTVAAAVCLIAFSFVYAADKRNDVCLAVNPLLVGVLAITACLPNKNIFALSNPFYWTCVLILLCTAGVSIRVFVLQEIKLAYLTNNLQAEVVNRTKDLHEVIGERDQLLQYLSHDMKKPVSSIERFLGILRERENDEEQKKTIDIIFQKTQELGRAFAELSTYSKNNFTVEMSSAFQVDELLAEIYNDLEPDCSANGIILTVNSSNISVYGKTTRLTSVIKNLIFNSIEHAQCKNITVTAFKRKDTCFIAVTDDGKGLSPDAEIFRPGFTDKSSSDNSGLGLYISRNFMRSMNGDITVSHENGKLTFLVSLPLA